MRRRKQILLIGKSERDLMAFSYALNTKAWGQCVYAIDAPSACEALRSLKVDVVVVYGDESWVPVIRKSQSDCRLLLIEAGPEATHADVRISMEATTGEIVEMLRILCARKRGPKPRGDRSCAYI